MKQIKTPRYFVFGIGALLLFAMSATSKCKKSSFIDCHEDRQTVSEVKDIQGTIAHVGGNNWVINYKEDGSRRYLPCNLEDRWKVDQQKVVFSGLEKKINANERWVGTPFVLKKIQSKD